MSSNDATLIAHVDLDAFFATCEQRDNPEYRGKPVMVGARPGGRGVVAAASYEAREFGVHSAMPVSRAYRLCPEGIYLRPDFAKYSAASKQVFAVLHDISPTVEKASIDEAYLDISGLDKLLGSPETIGRRIKDAIHEATGLTASVGIGPNRLIAKLGSDHNKPDGLTVVPAADVLDFLAPMPVENLRGNGRVTQQKFARLGLKTIAQVRAADPEWLAHHLGRRAAAGFQRQANGIASAEVKTGRQRKSISKERTFQQDQQAPDKLRSVLVELAQQVAATARRESLAGKVVRLKVRYRDFTTLTRQKTLHTPTQDDKQILATAWALLNAGDLPPEPVRLIGVGISDWADIDGVQGDMFSTTATQSDPRLLQTMDDITARFGTDKLQRGSRRGS
ncbi:MAG: DNA polymerase IV [Gammaproteobacteria bacterium]|nr:DNA polymerase IV [Gammaproteobacteria bacterium]